MVTARREIVSGFVLLALASAGTVERSMGGDVLAGYAPAAG